MTDISQALTRRTRRESRSANWHMSREAVSISVPEVLQPQIDSVLICWWRYALAHGGPSLARIAEHLASIIGGRWKNVGNVRDVAARSALPLELSLRGAKSRCNTFFPAY